VAPPSLSDLELPPREGDVELADLVRFLKHPVKEFLRRRLDLALPDDGEEVSDGLPVELDGLGQWAVGDRMLRDLLAGHDRTRVLGKEWRRGSLPPGQLGWRMANEIVDKAIPVAECAESVMQGRAVDALDVDVDLGDDRRLRGTVTDLYGDRLIKVTYSRMGPKQLLDVWIPLLALCAARPGRTWTAGVIARAKPVARATFTPVDDAPTLLAELVRLYDAGMREPLPLPLKTCEAWARHHQRPKQAWFKANDAWAKDKFAPERDDESHVRIWGRGADLDALLTVPPRPGEEWGDQESRLGALACRLWTPILERVIS
jgi:exodeoxyribonuclease V gamma subunit